MVAVLDFSTLPNLWQQYERTPRQLAYRATTQTEWAAWHEQLKTKIVELLGEFPPAGVELQPRVLETHDLPNYKLEKVALQTEVGIHIPCYVLTPHHVSPPYRPVIALHGH